MSATLTPSETSSDIPSVHSISEALAARRFVRRVVDQTPDEPVHDEVVIDCRDIQRISSEDLNALIRFYGEIRRESATLTLVNVCGTLGKVFALTRLDRMMSIG